MNEEQKKAVNKAIESHRRALESLQDEVAIESHRRSLEILENEEFMDGIFESWAEVQRHEREPL